VPAQESGGEVRGNEGHPPRERPTVADRINVALITEAADALSKLQERTQLKKVDIVNRALSLYEFIDAELRAGNELLVRNGVGESQRIKIF